MGAITDWLNSWLREYVIDGSPSSGPNKPVKSEGRAGGPIIEAAIADATYAGAVQYVVPTLAELLALTGVTNGQFGYVFANSDVTLGGLYVYSTSTSPTGWQQTDFPYAYTLEQVVATVQPMVDDAAASAAAAAASASSITALLPLTTMASFILTNIANYWYAIVDSARRVAIGIDINSTLKVFLNSYFGGRTELADAVLTPGATFGEIEATFLAGFSSAGPRGLSVVDSARRLVIGSYDGKTDGTSLKPQPAGLLAQDVDTDYWSARDPDTGLYQVYCADADTPGSAVTQLSTGGGDNYNPIVDRSGTRIIFSTTRRDAPPGGMMWVPKGGGTERAAIPYRRIVVWSDSRTTYVAGTGSTPGKDVVSLLARSAEVMAIPQGWGGQVAGGIVTRAGARTVQLTALSNIILAATPTTVTAISYDFMANTSVLVRTIAGTWDGVHGVLSFDPSGSTYTFLQDAGGTDTAISAASDFIPDLSWYPEAITVIGAGYNDITNGSSTDILPAIEDLDTFLLSRTISPRRLILGIYAGAGNGIGTPQYNTMLSINADLVAYAGADSFLDCQALLQANGDGGVNDNADIAAGLVPRSLRVDTVHTNDLGNAVIAAGIKARMISLGWI